MPQHHPLLKAGAVEDAISTDNLYIVEFNRFLAELNRRLENVQVKLGLCPSSTRWPKWVFQVMTDSAPRQLPTPKRTWAPQSD